MAVEDPQMTMRTLLTAAAIISSAIGMQKAPVSPSINDSSFTRLGLSVVTPQPSDDLKSLDHQFNPLPPEPWAKADPADSLYRLAREAMSRGDWTRAAELFRLIPQRFRSPPTLARPCTTRPTRSIGAAAKMT